MNAIEFILTYTISGTLCFVAGWLLGVAKAEDEVTRIRRWWMQRETRRTRERK
jgi:hypothetical protein